MGDAEEVEVEVALADACLGVGWMMFKDPSEEGLCVMKGRDGEVPRDWGVV